MSTPKFVITFLIYHELLHHEDQLSHWAGPTHGGDFRERERRFPRHVDADAWLDTFDDHHVHTASPTDVPTGRKRGVSWLAEDGNRPVRRLHGDRQGWDAEQPPGKWDRSPLD